MNLSSFSRAKNYFFALLRINKNEIKTRIRKEKDDNKCYLHEKNDDKRT